MPHPADTPSPLDRAVTALSPAAPYILALGVALLAGVLLVTPMLARLSLGIFGLTFLFLAMIIRLLFLRRQRSRSGFLSNIENVVRNDATPCFLTDADGRLLYRNNAALERAGAGVGAGGRQEAGEGQAGADPGPNHTLAAELSELIAAPMALMTRLKNKAIVTGAASEDVVMRRGHIRLSVHQVNEDSFLWRLEDLGGRGPAGRSGETINLPMMTVSKSGTILFMNEAARRLLGGRQTALDRVFTDLPVANGKIAQVSTADGPMPVLVCQMPSTAGRSEIYLLPEPENNLVEPEEWDLVDALPVPLLKLDVEGRIIMANRRARQLIGDDSPVGSLLSDQVEGAGRPISEWLRDVMEGRPAGRSEVVRALNTENEVFLQVSLEQVVEPDGKILVAVLQDATELKTMEAQYLQSQKMQAIGQLAGGIAHDFNNLLTAISGHCDLLLLRHDESDQDYADLSQIHQNANRAATLVGQLLSFSRKQTLRPEVIDLTDTLNDLTHLLNRLVGETVDLVLTQPAEVLPIRADKRHLEQVLMNLVVNARDAMPDGGTIRIETQNIILEKPLLRDRAKVPPGEYVTIRVIDQGVGIAPDKLTKVFEPFFTTKGAGKGTGLGLSMAYGIVKQTGGFIFVDSEPGISTTFTLYFPVASQNEMVSDPPVVGQKDDTIAQTEVNGAIPSDGRTIVSDDMDANGVDQDSGPLHSGPLPVFLSSNAGVNPTKMETENPKSDIETPIDDPEVSITQEDPGNGGVVLLVEDEAPVRAFASRALRMRGFTVLEAENAEEALEKLKDTSLEVDIFVTDVIMPGMDGPTWVAQALEDRPGVKVVFVSGYAKDSISEHQARIPNSTFLPKPFSLSQLTNTVQRQLH